VSNCQLITPPPASRVAGETYSWPLSCNRPGFFQIRQPLAIARARPVQTRDPPPAGARFTVPDPRSAASWSRSSAPDPPAAGRDPPPAGQVFRLGSLDNRGKKHGF